MTIIATLLVVLVALGLLFWRGTKGVARSLAELDRPIRGLLRQGHNGGFLVINRYRKTPFVQLRKYIRKPGDYGIELAFPLVSWSVPFQSKLERLCIEQGIDFVEGSKEGGLPFIYVDFQRDIGKAHSFVVDVLTQVFQWGEDTRCFTVLENGDIRDVLIDR